MYYIREFLKNWKLLLLVIALLWCGDLLTTFIGLELGASEGGVIPQFFADDFNNLIILKTISVSIDILILYYLFRRWKSATKIIYYRTKEGVQNYYEIVDLRRVKQEGIGWGILIGMGIFVVYYNSIAIGHLLIYLGGI